jgi:hypothetical protein
VKIAISKENIRDIIIAISFLAIFFYIIVLIQKMNREQIMWTGVIMIITIIGGASVYAELRAYFNVENKRN